VAINSHFDCTHIGDTSLDVSHACRYHPPSTLLLYVSGPVAAFWEIKKWICLAWWWHNAETCSYQQGMAVIGKHLKLFTGHKFIITNCIIISRRQRYIYINTQLNDTVLKLCTFYVRSINREKRPLTSSPRSVSQHVSARIPLDRLPWDFISGTSMKICPGAPKMFKITQIYGKLRMKT
jgi:hypothetical protein